MTTRTTLSTLFILSMICFQSRAAQPFWDESFASGFPANWTTGDLSGNNVKWEYCSNYKSCPPAIFTFFTCYDPRFESMSFENGYLYVNSFAHQSITSKHISYLQSAPVDCSSKPKVFLKFSTFIDVQSIDPDTGAVLQVKAGNGPWVSYTIFKNLNENLVERRKSWNPQLVLLDISAQAANQPEIYFRWKWTGFKEMAWIIDDVELFDSNPLYEKTVWGNLPGQGDFQNGLNGWTIISSPNGCKWIWDANGLVDTPDADLLADASGSSPTAYNGMATVNATTCQVLPPGNLMTKTDLISPSINLAGVTAGTRLALRFFQTVKPGNAGISDLPVTSVAISLNNGLSYADTIEANSLLPFRKSLNGETTLSLPLATAGSSQVKIRFIFSGDSDFWIIDDVRIIERWDNDLQVNPGFAAVAPNFTMPKSQVSPIGFSAEVENTGQFTQEMTSLYITVKNEVSGAVVFRDTFFIGSVEPGELIEDAIFPKLFSPPAETATYTCQYSVGSALTDEDTTNNFFRWQFNVSENSFSKDNGLCGINGYFTPNDNVRYETGNCYYVPNGSGYCASSLSFAFRNAPSLAGATLQISLYQWKKDGNIGDVNTDTLANENEYERLSVNLYKVIGSENNKIITVPLDDDNNCIPLEDSTYYFVTINYNDPVVDNQGNYVPFFIAASEEINYTGMFWLSYYLGLPRYVSMLREANDLDFTANGWALRRIPFVKMNIQMLTDSKEQPSEEVVAKILPNPASDYIFAQLNPGLSGGSIEAGIFDIRGKLVASRQFQNTNVSQLPFDIGFLSNGTYILRVITDKGSATGKFIVHRN